MVDATTGHEALSFMNGSSRYNQTQMAFSDDFPLPITEIMVDATTGHEALSFMNGSSRYNQTQMALSDEELTAFRTPKGIYCYKVIACGLKNVGATYLRAMQKVFDDMLHKYVECYVDDFVVKYKRRQDHLKDLHYYKTGFT
ncbi:RNA-directed DNA polymerase-like protein [Cucumis melo var. makuwa]|uniref:RNA-directed DNA polymerase-like protein n=1 Tax=Cucumis melo var. makuwa TaxID=1194695 RepID=A0A5A7TZJ3_CUCMM|nr:RNA-directed DNA polymerase-like protein [Cucumis melo var. makuwa]